MDNELNIKRKTSEIIGFFDFSVLYSSGSFQLLFITFVISKFVVFSSLLVAI